MNEAFRRALLNSYDYYQARRWEGKPFPQKMKFIFTNYTEILLGTVTMCVILPLVIAYKSVTYDTSYSKAIKKYRPIYMVARHDDPNIQEIIDEKELGRHYFPQN